MTKKKLKIAYLPAAQNQKRTGKGLKFKSIPSSQHVETTEWMVIAINKQNIITYKQITGYTINKKN